MVGQRTQTKQTDAIVSAQVASLVPLATSPRNARLLRTVVVTAAQQIRTRLTAVTAPAKAVGLAIPARSLHSVLLLWIATAMEPPRTRTRQTAAFVRAKGASRGIIAPCLHPAPRRIVTVTEQHLTGTRQMAANASALTTSPVRTVPRRPWAVMPFRIAMAMVPPRTWTPPPSGLEHALAP
jgi:hypothetical protein